MRFKNLFHLRSLVVRCIVILAGATASALGGEITGDPHSSPFADKPCDSYSSYNGIDNQRVNPLWGSLQADDFGSRTIKMDPTGEREVNQIPAGGVHPRICFTPDDLPDIRRRLKETRAGQQAWNNILAWTTMMKGEYDETAEYAKPDLYNGSYSGLHAHVPLWRLGIPRAKGFTWSHCQPAGAIYQSLVDGSAQTHPPMYWPVMSLEAFRCLIEEDHQGAQRLARATITAMRLAQAQREAARRQKPTTAPPAEPLFDTHTGVDLAFIYDFIYSDLTAEQRQLIHEELANTTWSHDNYGTFNTATASRSNWATFSYWLFEVLSIEGEPGFNDLKVRGMYRGWRNLLTYGWFQSGATFEGEAKDQLGMDGIIMFAMRAKDYGFDNLTGHPYLRAYATQFLPKSVIPTQDGFIKYDLLGGAHGKPFPPDAIGLKYMLPNDKTIDWVYHKAIGDNYENIPDRPDGYANSLLFAAIYAMDFDPSNNDAGKLGIGNTFFCPERSLMMTRSGWSGPDEVMLNMHTRQANGGHPFADRNAIMLAGAGRVWSPSGYATFTTAENSVVDIDGKTQSVYGPGRMIDFKDTPQVTYAVGDASYSWDWEWKQLDRPKGVYTIDDVRAGAVKVPSGWEPETRCVNDFSMLKLPYDYLNTPMFQQAHWILPAGALRPVVRQACYPVARSIRTSALVRGKHPFALIVDDIQKDDAVHHYDWTFTLERDIQITAIRKTSGREMDILLTGDDPRQENSYDRKGAANLPGLREGPAVPQGQPMLLVLVLNRTGSGADPAVEMLPNQTDAKKYGPIRRLVIPCDSVSPEFKVLLYPYRQGADLPVTHWSDDRSQVEIAWPDQHNSARFAAGEGGRTIVEIN
jgi:hypothetical protein